MRTAAFLSVLCCVAAPRLQAEELAQPSCRFIRDLVQRLVQTGPIIQLSAKPVAASGALGAGAGMTCKGFERLKAALLADKAASGSGVVLGSLAGQKIAVARDGPHGSGRFWDVQIALQTPDGVIGGCTSASTTAWRNLHPFAHRFGHWDLLGKTPSGQQRFVLWWSIEGHELASNSEHVLVPLAYRLEGTRLVVDGEATRTALARFGRIYSDIAALPDNDFTILHRAAGAAFRAVHEETPCSPSEPGPH